MINFSAVIRWHAERQPDKEALVYQERRMTYRELDRRISAAAKGLLELGVMRGDRVALLLYNCPEFLETAFAANRLGAAFLPLNYRLAGEEIAYILNDSGAKVLLTEEEFHSTITSIAREVRELEHVVTVGGAVPGGWLNYTGLVKGGYGVDVPDADVGPEDLHRLMYTSGTTAHPKGVMITYGNLYWKNFAHILDLGITRDEVGLVAGPLYHVGGLDLSALHVMHAGGMLVIIRRFDVKAVLRAVERERITLVWLAPTMLNMLLNDPDLKSSKLDSVRVIIDGGEKMPEPLIRRLLEAFPNAWFADAYGLTETVSGDTFLSKDKTLEKLGSVGRPTAHLELRVVDDEGRDALRRQVGEIVLKGPKVFKGYWNNPKATEEAVRDGWFHTGDMGMLDEEGYLYIVDRKKDMIKSGGENIASLEVERVLYQHPKVFEAAVVGVPDERWGEVPLAYIVPKKGQSMVKEELIEFCAGKLAKFKIPKHAEFIDALPRNPSGKVLKRDLREMARAMTKAA